jgi:hypothetical protein
MAPYQVLKALALYARAKTCLIFFQFVTIYVDTIIKENKRNLLVELREPNK